MADIILSGNVKIQSKPEAFARAVAKDWLKYINQGIRSKLDTFKAALWNRVYNNVFDALQPLVEDDLRAVLGLSVGHAVKARLQIAKMVADETKVTFRNFRLVAGNRILGGLTVHCILEDHSALLGKGWAQVTDKHKQAFPWLQWLLFEGRKFVSDYYLLSKAKSPRVIPYSSSREAIMVRSSKGWQMPALHAGTKGDNIITNALGNNFELFVAREFKRLLV